MADLYKIIPSKEEDLLEWLNRFIRFFPASALNCGITPAEISVLISMVNEVAESIERNRLEKEQKSTMLKFVINIIIKMKKHPHYLNDRFANELGIYM